MNNNFALKVIFISLILFSHISSNAQRNKINLYPYKQENKWGYVNKRKKVKILFIFEKAFDFYDELAIVKKDGKYGFINSSGTEIIKCKYDYASPFINSYARVIKDSLEGLIRKDGSLFLNKWFYQILPFNNGFAKVICKNDSLSSELSEPYLVAYVNTAGQKLANRWFSGGGSFLNGLAKVSISGEYFYLDTLGRIEFCNQEEPDEAAPFIPGKQQFSVPDEMPKFPGGELGLRRYIAANLNILLKQGNKGLKELFMLDLPSTSKV